MQRTLQQHFAFIEERIKEPHSGLPFVVAKHWPHLKLQVAELALDHFRAALELEAKISSFNSSFPASSTMSVAKRRGKKAPSSSNQVSYCAAVSAPM
jgi:hypothetical protein